MDCGNKELTPNKIKVLWTNFPPWVAISDHDFEKSNGVLPSMMNAIGTKFYC